MKSLFKIALILLPGLVYAGDPNDDQVSRTVTRSYSMTNEGNLELINKYGQVVITQWDKDSVSFNIEIIGYGKTRSDARKTLERVDIDFDKTSQYLTVETVFDRASNFVVEVWKNFSDESRAILSKSKIEINYEIFVPAGMDITLDNRYGDVFLNEMDGKLNLEIMHGNLRANNINSNSTVQVGFGDVRIKYLKSGRLDLKAADGNIVKVGNIDINSGSSELVIREADRVRIDSRSDKRIRLNDVKSLSGKGLFSNISVGTLRNSLEMDMSYGDIRAENILFNFSRIDIDSKSTDMDLHLNSKSYITVEIEGNEQDMFLPMVFNNLDRKQTDSKKKLVLLSGKVGSRNNYPAILNIYAQGGDVNISYEDREENEANNSDKY